METRRAKTGKKRVFGGGGVRVKPLQLGDQKESSFLLHTRFNILDRLMQSSSNAEEIQYLNILRATSGKIGHLHYFSDSFLEYVAVLLSIHVSTGPGQAGNPH